MISEHISRTSFWVLVAFFALLFFVGGSSWGNEPGLIILRPVAILLLAYGLSRFSKDIAKQYWAILSLFCAAAALVVAHLIALPPSVWMALSGRELLVRVDEIADLGEISRPLSVAPEATLNSLYSLAIPAAVLANACLLSLNEQMRLMLVVLGFILASALVTVSQSVGSDVAFYSFTSTTPGIFANRNHQGTLIAVGFPVLAASSYFLARWRLIDPRLTKVIAASVGLAFIPLIIIMGSRAGLALSVVGLLLMPFVIPRVADPVSLKAKFGALALRWVGALASIGTMIWLTFAASREVVFSRLTDSSEDSRLPIWGNVVSDLHTWMPWGSGIGSFADAYQVNESPWALGPKFLNHVHNDWLEVVYTAGIPGAALMSVAIGLFAWGAWRLRKTQGRAAVLARSGILIIFLLALASISDYPIRTPIMSAILALAAVWASFPQEVRK